MYKRLIILSVIIFAAMCGLIGLGYHSIRIWAQGMEGTRIGEFAEVAEQISQDVKRNFDAFMTQEQNRPYTDYQYYYVPDNAVTNQQQMAVLRSPLAGKLEHGLAYGHFQIQPDNKITTPIISTEGQQAEEALERDKAILSKALANTLNIKNNLFSALSASAPNTPNLSVGREVVQLQKEETKTPAKAKLAQQEPVQSKLGKDAKALSDRAQKSYPIESFQNLDQEAQIITQSRTLVTSNFAQNPEAPQQQAIPPQSQEQIEQETLALQEQFSDEQIKDISPARRNEAIDGNLREVQTRRRSPSDAELEQQINESISMADRFQSQSSADQRGQVQGYGRSSSSQPQAAREQYRNDLDYTQEGMAEQNQSDMVEIRVDPFEPVIAPGEDVEQSIFGGQVFMLRGVQIEDVQFQQGFRLNEEKLLEEIEKSAQRFVREDMSFELSRTQNEHSAYTAILNFGFGHLLLNLIETDPGSMTKRIDELRRWFFSIVTIVLLAVTLGLASLWRNARAQLKLAQKKDDFISAVSHELRTPLTSIRMYSEMLEKNWVKSQDKAAEYYKNMRQESERLSRLIENVLDFSRIQRGRKKYSFSVGDLNKSVADVVEMMRPHATQKGFSIRTELGRVEPSAFDGDAVTQIVVNLLDNAIKYARNAEDKTILVRTASNNGYVLIEVEDRGPGIPHWQRKKIFEQFYRAGAEATRETTGTGLGLALVKKFAEAHNGFVEIINAKPTGAIFRVALAVRE
ncbi:sensor histidine kinase [Planctomycetota bacterium]